MRPGWAVRWAVVQHFEVFWSRMAARSTCVLQSSHLLCMGLCSNTALLLCRDSMGTWLDCWGLMGFRGDNRAEPGNSRSGRKAGLRARENLLGGGGARHSVQFPQPLLAGTLAHSVGLTHGPAPTPQDCESVHK